VSEEKKMSDIRVLPDPTISDAGVDQLVREAEQYLGPVNVTSAMRDAIRSRRIKVVQSSNGTLGQSDCISGTGDAGCCTVTLYNKASSDGGCGPYCI